MEPVKADIIEYISDNGEKYSLIISEMISTEMIAKINSGKEKLTEEESYKLDEVFIWFNEIQCRLHGVMCSKFIRRNSCNIAIIVPFRNCVPTHPHCININCVNIINSIPN